MAAGAAEPSQSLDLDARPRGLRGLDDFTVGLEEEFALVDPDSLELVHRFEELYARLPGGRAARRVGRRRADRHRDRDPLRPRRDASPRRSSCQREHRDAAVRARRAARDRRSPRPGPTRGRTTSTSGSSTPSTTTACARSCAGSRSATTPGACTSTSASAAPTARSPSATTCAGCCRRCWRCRRTRRSSTARTPGCTRCAPRSSPAPSRAAASTSRSATGRAYADFIDLLDATGSVVESTQLWWSVRPHHALRHGRAADLRRADARRRGVRLAGADHRLHRPVGARLRRRPRSATPLRQREIEENLWRAIRHGLDGTQIDFAARAR